MTKKAAPREFDLADRTARFGEDVIRFVQTIKRNAITGPLVSQLDDLLRVSEQITLKQMKQEARRNFAIESVFVDGKQGKPNTGCE